MPLPYRIILIRIKNFTYSCLKILLFRISLTKIYLFKANIILRSQNRNNFSCYNVIFFHLFKSLSIFKGKTKKVYTFPRLYAPLFSALLVSAVCPIETVNVTFHFQSEIVLSEYRHSKDAFYCSCSIIF